MRMAELANDLAVIGGNNPPEPTPFDLSKDEIDDLFAEAKNFLDGEEIRTQGVADEVGRLIDKIRKAKALADDRRKAEAKPFDDGKKEVQARYNPLIQEGKGKCDLAILTCKEALAPFLAEQDRQKRAAAEKARAEAEAKQRTAEEALRASRAADLAQREEAERLLDDAKKAAASATRLEKDKASVAGGARSIGMRRVPKPYLTDGREAARHYWPLRRSEIEALLLTFAEADVRAGSREIPGFDIIEEVAIQ